MQMTERKSRKEGKRGKIGREVKEGRTEKHGITIKGKTPNRNSIKKNSIKKHHFKNRRPTSSTGDFDSWQKLGALINFSFLLAGVEGSKMLRGER